MLFFYYGNFDLHLCFFFSSRRRHTRWNCDWSSDVCSSDLPVEVGVAVTRGDDGSQGTLFDDSEVPGLPGGSATQGIQGQPEAGALPAEIGYRGPTACAAAG